MNAKDQPPNAFRLRQQFHETFPGAHNPFICRAPGRVNIIGEHTDYNGLPVLPMTLERDIRIACAPRQDAQVRIRDTDRAFPPREFANQPEIEPSPSGSWDNYCKAAIQGINRHFQVKQCPGMDLLVTGTIPISAGLSSSSALVVACALAYLRCLGKQLEQDMSRLTLAALLADAEHYVGTRGGGMDQAIILLGHENQACKIDFFPLRTETAPLPEGYAFVVCNSLVKAEKTGDALHRYNAGPRLCQLICALVARQAQREFGDEIEIRRLGDLWQGHLCLTHAEVCSLFDRAIPKPVLRLSEAAAALKISPDEIRTRWLGDLKEPPEGFRLQARARHQITEYQRVETARDAMLSGDAETLGALMNASHESCAQDYEVSCPELDALVNIARSSGAIGARLTGAGFGGCTVNLVPETNVESFMENVRRAYYDDYLKDRSLPHSPDAIFIARSTSGAGYLD